MADLTANEQFYNYLARHQIGLLLLAESIKRQVFQPLDATEADIRDAIRARLATSRGLVRPEDVRRLETLLRIIQRIRAGGWERATRAAEEQLEEVTAAEPEQTDQALLGILPVVLPKVAVGAAVIAAILARPMLGRTIGGWFQAMRDDETARVRAAVTMGMRAGQTADEIAMAVLGAARPTTGAAAPTTLVVGAITPARRAIETVLLTAVNFYPGEARAAWAQLRKDILDEELFVAVLDSRTTPVCRANDGKVFPLGVGPHPPLHPRCRSHRMPIVNGEKVGMREAKPFTERMLREEFDATGRPEREWDAFRERRVRELTGTVPMEVSYEDWLRSQPARFQAEILGTTRYRLFREGGLRLDQFVNAAGRQLTLKELQALHKSLFADLGIQI